MVKDITREDFQKIQECLTAKQKFLQKGLDNLNKQDFEKAKIMFSIEQGFAIEIVKILDEYIIPKDNKDSIDKTDETDETMYEDVNKEQEGEI